MKRSSTQGQRERKLPVFIFPEELKFISGNEVAHKQILTLYNPYDFNIKFQSMCNYIPALQFCGQICSNDVM